MKIKTLITSSLLVISFGAFGQEKSSTPLSSRPVDIGFIYPLTTNGVDAPKYNYRLSLQAIAGVSGGITGGAFAGIANIVKGDATGGLFAGILNSIGHNATGGQFAGILNRVKGNSEGFQAAGLVNMSNSMKGVQTAGLGNITYQSSKTIQISGLFNKANEAHTQISGLINIAKKITGVQLSGLVNIADSSDYAIGFVNLIKNGEKSIGISINESQNIMASFYSGGKHLYGIVGIGYNVKSKYNVYALQAGIGGHLLQWGNAFRVNAEALQLVQTDFKHGHCYTYTLSVLPEIKIHQKLAIFAGPTANLQLDYSDRRISSVTNHYFWTTKGHDGHFIGSYIGVTGGIQFIL